MTKKRRVTATGERKTTRPDTPEEIRVRAIRETIEAIVDLDMDAINQIEEKRSLAATLKLPYVVVVFATDSNIRADGRIITEADITEYNAWRAQLAPSR